MVKPIKNISGLKFGRLTPVEYDYNLKKWKCLCKCGNYKYVTLTHLQDGHCKSCGCLHRETSYLTGKNNIKHGKYGTRIYNIWCSMKNRCYYSKDKCYNIYGGRGITVYDDWLNKDVGFVNFFNWSIKNGYKDDLTIDRINTDGNYEPSNCRWITMLEQQSNKRNTIKITFNGVTKTITEWSNIYNINKETLYKRLKQPNKWSIEQALTTPTKVYNRGEQNK